MEIRPHFVSVCRTMPYLCLAQWFSVLWFAVWRNRSRPSNEFAESQMDSQNLWCMRFLRLWKINSMTIKQLAQADSRTNNDSRLGTHSVWLIISSHIVEHIWYWTYSFGSMFLSNCFVMHSCFELEDALAGGSPGFMNPWGEARQSLCPSWQHGGGAWLTRQKPKRYGTGFHRFWQFLFVLWWYTFLFVGTCGDPYGQQPQHAMQRPGRGNRGWGEAWGDRSCRGKASITLSLRWTCVYVCINYIYIHIRLHPPKKIGK